MRSVVLSCCVVMMVVAGALPAAAEWSENGRRIVTLSQVLSGAGPGCRSDLPGDMPVLLPEGADPDSPKALAVALVQSGYALNGPEGQWNVTRAIEDEGAQARLRLIPQYPVAPRSEDAIAAGGLLAYGRFIEGPYSVEALGGGVFVNGVQVFPSPGVAVEPPRVSEEKARRQGMKDAAWTRYELRRADEGEAAAREAFREEAMGWPDTRDAEWIADGLLALTRLDGSLAYMSFDERRREPDADPGLAQRELAESTAEGLRESLVSGHMVAAGATYLFSVPDTGAYELRGRLEEILDAPEPELLKLARIQARLGRREAAADLLYAR